MNENPLPPILTLEQAAGYLQLTIEELQAELETGGLPGLKVAGKWRVKREVLDRLLEVGREAPDNLASSTNLQESTEELPRSPKTVEEMLQPAQEEEATEHLSEMAQSEPIPKQVDVVSIVEKDNVLSFLENGAATNGRNEKVDNVAELALPAPAVPSCSVSPTPPEGRLRARVFTYNPQQGFGYARLPDNRIIWIDAKH
jgi:excisionase family DNA binding protein